MVMLRSPTTTSIHVIIVDGDGTEYVLKATDHDRYFGQDDALLESVDWSTWGGTNVFTFRTEDKDLFLSPKPLTICEDGV